MEVVTKEAKEIEYLYSNKKPMIPLTKEQQDADASSTHCYICDGPFTKEDWKVRHHCHLTDDKVSLLMRKGCFPYDYVSDVEKLNDTCLPPKEKFYSRLNDEDITDDDYQHANHCGIIPCTRSFMGLNAETVTKVKIELLIDYDMYLFVEKGIRGGISQCSNRYARANNKFLPNFEPSKPPNFLLYLDANNLYGWAMSQPLPLNNFKWVDFLDVDHIDENGEKGYILEVDLEYPESLHDYHSDLPLAPESSVLPGYKEKRLLTTIYPRTNYVVHIRNLKQYLKLGLVLKKVHKILEFLQESWLQPYIKMNTQFRTEAENEFEKNFYKLMNNAIFGKTMENIRKRVDIRLCSNEEKAKNYIYKPNFKDRTIFGENLVAFHMGRTSLTLNKPIAVRMSILDISKTLIDEAHFWLNGYVNKQNCPIWSEANPQVYVETPLHPEKLTVWCALWAGGILLQKR
ncbi:uncharacterized protein TNCV_2841301 [Trichonephila clavipes]|uniref:DNA-directed DNA polymerase n=1 Tax=Trichonephila clavipes TaxID=2585209 RepID=A0A8X6RNS6_TRICX|nr:uncharacterized protein TNCV_2841301 [Trichonephila clavipes]